MIKWPLVECVQNAVRGDQDALGQAKALVMYYFGAFPAKDKLKKELFLLAREEMEASRLDESFEKKVRAQIRSLFHMQIPVERLDESIEWYKLHLGFQLREHYGTCAFLSISTGPMLMLWQTTDGSTANFTVNGNMMPVLLYATDDVHALHDQLQEAGTPIAHYQDDGFGWVLKFFDPNGNMWGVIQEKK